MKRSVLLLAIFLGVAFSNVKASEEIGKYQALYIYNICRYVEWPASFNQDNFVIGIVGYNSSLESALKQLSGSKKIQNKSIVVKRISSPADAASCNILFFSSGKESSISSYKASAENALYISESTHGILKGSDINFFMEGNKLKFALGDKNLSAKDLQTSAALRQLASNN